MNATRQTGDPIPAEVRAAILAELQQGDPYDAICARYGVNKQYVSRIAVRNGLRRKDKQGALTFEQEVQVARRYHAGEKSIDLAAEFNVSRDTIMETLNRRGIPARGKGHVPWPMRHDALDVLTPEAAYWCGFIFTDGHISRRPGRTPQVAVVLQKRDRDHLVKFRDFLDSAHAITPVAPSTVSPNAANPKGSVGTGAFRYAITSQQLADCLTTLGRYGPAVDPELAASRHFWRGCIDGDGTVGASCGIPQLKLVGSRWLLGAFVDFLGPVGSRRPLNVRPARNIFVVSTSYKTAVKVIGRLYTDAPVALDRKAAAAAQILSEY